MSYVYVKLETSLGDIVLELDPDAAPITVGNFMEYVVEKHYDDTIFHRVIAGFMIQGGGMNEGMSEKCCKHEPIRNEANNGLKNDKYTLAMARTSDPHSATSQFFINTHKNDFLNFSSETPRGWGYAVFGKVVEGFKVVDQIEDVETTSRSFHDDVPVKPVILKSASILKEYEPPKA